MSSFFQGLSEKKNYQEYLRRIDPEIVLDHYGMQNSSHIQIGDQVEVQHSCLIDRVDKHHSNGDSNPSASMNLNKKSYYCFSYGGGDIFWFIRTMEQKETFEEIVPLLGQFLSGSTEQKEDFLEELEKYFSTTTRAEDPIPEYSTRVLKQWSYTHPYLVNQRGMSHEACKRLKVGYDIEENRIVFPLIFESKLLGWQKRAVPGGLGYPPTEPDHNGVLAKYKNTPSLPKSRSLYGADLANSRERDTVVVVESPMSCLKAETLTDGEDLLSGVIATMGAKVSEFQVKYLRRYKKVYVYFDGDEAGRRGCRYLVENLHRHTEVVVVEPEHNKDLGDYNSRREVLELFEKRTVPAFLWLASVSKGS